MNELLCGDCWLIYCVWTGELFTVCGLVSDLLFVDW